jgi:hypothetical protein
VAKQVTREQAERKKAQAATLMERIGDDDRADEFDEMSVEEYAEHRGFQIARSCSIGQATVHHRIGLRALSTCWLPRVTTRTTGADLGYHSTHNFIAFLQRG